MQSHCSIDSCIDPRPDAVNLRIVAAPSIIPSDDTITILHSLLFFVRVVRVGGAERGGVGEAHAPTTDAKTVAAFTTKKQSTFHYKI